jgi:hypothetical protein
VFPGKKEPRSTLVVSIGQQHDQLDKQVCHQYLLESTWKICHEKWSNWRYWQTRRMSLSEAPSNESITNFVLKNSNNSTMCAYLAKESNEILLKKDQLRKNNTYCGSRRWGGGVTCDARMDYMMSKYRAKKHFCSHGASSVQKPKYKLTLNRCYIVRVRQTYLQEDCMISLYNVLDET